MNTAPQQNDDATTVPGGWWASWLLAIVVVLLCLIAGELFLRRWFPLDGVLLQRDTRYLYKYIPGARARTAHIQPAGHPRGDTVLVAINSQGRRGETVSKDASTLRVMVCGDSFVAGEFSLMENSFVYRLEKELSARLGRRVQVINGGVPGYGPDQESLVLEDQIDSLKPDLVIAAIYSINDFGDLVRNKLFALDRNGQLIRRQPAPALDVALNKYFDQAKSLPRFQVVRRFKRLVATVRSSETVWKLKVLLHLRSATSKYVPPPAPPLPTSTERIQKWLALRVEEYRSTIDGQDNLVHNLLSDTYDADVSLALDSPSSLYKRALMARMMEWMESIASKRSIPMAFLIVPGAIDTSEWDVAVDPAVFPGYRRSELTDILERIAKERHVPYLNLFQPFREHWREELYYHIPDDHWNTAGQKLAAALTADFIVRDQLLHPAPAKR